MVTRLEEQHYYKVVNIELLRLKNVTKVNKINTWKTFYTNKYRDVNYELSLKQNSLEM